MDEKSVTANLPTQSGNFKIIVWPAEKGLEPAALVTPELNVKKPVYVRVHSECLTGDTFGSLRCDCGQQKKNALRIIKESKNGILIYLRQEGRGIGLFEKIKAYQLQEKGYDTHEANILLGYDPDLREYAIVKDILNELQVTEVKLITNNPSKVDQIRHLGFTIVEQVPLIVKSNKHNKKYLETKRVKLKHFEYNDEYYYGVSDIKKSQEIQTIATLAKKLIKDPQLRIYMGISADSTFLKSNIKQKLLMKLFSEAEQFSPPLVPVLHYSFKNSKNYLRDIEELVKRFPFMEVIQLNDLTKDHKEVYMYAAKHFKVILSINDKFFTLLTDSEFAGLIRMKKSVILLDNSEGKGKEESLDSYKWKIHTLLNNGINEIGIAGGFGPNHLQTYIRLKDYFKIHFSIDAQTNLKKNGDLDLKKTTMYLTDLLTLT